MKNIIGAITLALVGMVTINASADTARDAARLSLSSSKSKTPKQEPQSNPIAAAAQPNLTFAKAEPVGGAMKVVVPQKDLETAIRSSNEGDILIYDGVNAWYHVDSRALQTGTRVFVLGTGSLVSVFPKEGVEGEAVR